MKSTLSVILALSLFMGLFAGCSEPTTVNTAAQQTSAPKLLSGLLDLVTTILLPPSNQSRSASKTVTCYPGSNNTISLSYTYNSLLGLPVTRTATLKVPAGALNQTTSITMRFDSTDASVHFSPEGLVFNRAASLDFSASGLLPLGLQPIGFYYIADNGDAQQMPAQSLSVIPLLGNITMQGGTVPHFSKYAFAR